jgi:hypothetical protein
MLDSELARSLIKPRMPVVCSNAAPFAVVDHMEGGDLIKLAKDEQGRHHYIPLASVTPAIMTNARPMVNSTWSSSEAR